MSWARSPPFRTFITRHAKGHSVRPKCDGLRIVPGTDKDQSSVYPPAGVVPRGSHAVHAQGISGPWYVMVACERSRQTCTMAATLSSGLLRVRSLTPDVMCAFDDVLRRAPFADCEGRCMLRSNETRAVRRTRPRSMIEDSTVSYSRTMPTPIHGAVHHKRGSPTSSRVRGPGPTRSSGVLLRTSIAWTVRDQRAATSIICHPLCLRPCIGNGTEHPLTTRNHP